jgi:signal transduction histidine kinase
MLVETLRDAHRARSPLLDEIFEESSAVVLEEVARLQKIVDEFSRFARLPPPSLGTVAVRELVAPLLALYATPPPGITFRADIDEGLPLVRVDRDQILQVLLNLVANAENAMEGRGAVRLAARAAPGGVVLSIDDDGPGVAPADRERIFEPYVTGSAGGTGLGLAISRRIAEEHGGSLEVDEAPGGGASFRLRLPAAAQRA